MSSSRARAVELLAALLQALEHGALGRRHRLARSSGIDGAARRPRLAAVPAASSARRLACSAAAVVLRRLALDRAGDVDGAGDVRIVEHLLRPGLLGAAAPARRRLSAMRLRQAGMLSRSSTVMPVLSRPAAARRAYSRRRARGPITLSANRQPTATSTIGISRNSRSRRLMPRAVDRARARARRRPAPPRRPTCASAARRGCRLRRGRAARRRSAISRVEHVLAGLELARDVGGEAARLRAAARRASARIRARSASGRRSRARRSRSR